MDSKIRQIHVCPEMQADEMNALCDTNRKVSSFVKKATKTCLIMSNIWSNMKMALCDASHKESAYRCCSILDISAEGLGHCAVF